MLRGEGKGVWVFSKRGLERNRGCEELSVQAQRTQWKLKGMIPWDREPGPRIWLPGTLPLLLELTSAALFGSPSRREKAPFHHAALSGLALDVDPRFNTSFAHVATMVRSRPNLPVGQGQVRGSTIFLLLSHPTALRESCQSVFKRLGKHSLLL